jgi:hypothetical protein
MFRTSLRVNLKAFRTGICSDLSLGIDIARNGIYITRDMADKALGVGFVACINMENAFKAIDLHNQKHMQHRFDRIWSFEVETQEEIKGETRKNREDKIRGEVCSSMVLSAR